ncbi:hypothetical protein LOTGIDRAFT_237143 [Lottia gigantea]|uniref:DUF4430 domain-containing protein n=1 Tax=Lottia gigantea TaxID=225164 RepID=V3YVY2_LOTGI|nr:hypothetical protein LOTGIDRAFT_237143 [Lottia gigantea]ESO82163.1 hypothetical protein LOTGIDRAFT_237143 [Lottia gigantea]
MEIVLKHVCLLALCCIFAVAGCNRGKSKDDSHIARPSDCESFEKIDVHLTIQNKIQPEYFEYNVTLHDVPKHQLIRHLELAAEKDKHFKFSSTYFPGMGYFINSINGLAGKWDPDQTFWEILNSDFAQVDEGASYIPNHEEFVVFNFTKSSH